MAVVTRLLFPDWMTAAALPFIKEAVDYGRNLRPLWFQDIFDMMSTDRPLEQFTTFTKFGLMVETAEAANVTYDTPLQGFDKTLTPLQYSLGFRISKIAFDDDKLGPLKNLSTGLGESSTESKNILSADILNQAFNSAFTGADGLELCSTVHLRENGETFRNELATSADFTITSFRTAQIDFRNFRDGRGKRLQLRPQWIINPPDLYWDVAEVLKSPDRPDTANRAANVNDFFGEGFPTQKTVDYLTDTDAWFLAAPKEDHGLKFLTREAFNSQSDVDFDSRTIKHAGWERFDVDWVNNGTGFYGSPGA